jgi:hypothetical protein
METSLTYFQGMEDYEVLEVPVLMVNLDTGVSF